MTTVMKQFFCGDGFKNKEHGTDLRDYFAAKAMQELLKWDLNVPVYKQSGLKWLGEYSYVIADQMMKAREK